jgi:regulator of protease activity HflC (stomatin/prohibitin superfamily)
MDLFALIIAAALGFGGLSGIKIVNQGDEALVERLGKYTGKKLQWWKEFRFNKPLEKE